MPEPQRVHLAWELGSGLGHAGRLAPVARAMAQRGWQVSLSLRDLALTQQLLHDLKLPRFQAPTWLHTTVGGPQVTVNHAELMMQQGYVNDQSLGALVDSWCALLDGVQAQVVVGDYAPTARLAARVRGLPFVAIGDGFTLPPPDAALPSLRDWEPVQPGRYEATEAHVLALCNRVLQARGAEPLGRLVELFRGDHACMCTWPALDHFGRAPEVETGGWLGLLSAQARVGEPPAWPKAPGPRAFAYLKDSYADHPAVLKALASSGACTLCYIPEVASGKQPPVVHPSIRYADGPVDLPAALAEADLCVCHGGASTQAQALRAGVPMLLLPQQGEQFLSSRQIERQGLGLCLATPGQSDLANALRALLAPDSAARRRAREAALQPTTAQRADAVNVVCDTICAATGV